MFQPKKKKIATSVITIALLSSMIAACGSPSTKTESSTAPSTGAATASTDPATSGKPVQFSYMLAGKYINWMKDLKWVPEIQKATNTQVDFVEGGKEDDDYYKTLDIRIGSKQFPDAGIVTLPQAEVYGSQGAFLDLAPLIDKSAPNIKKFIEANPAYKKLITAKDGKIFGLMQEYPTLSAVTFYRADLFKQAGITEPPKTIDQFTDDLRKLKAKFTDPNFYPYTGRDGFIKFMEAFDALSKIDANGKVHGNYEIGTEGGHVYDLHAPGFKKLIEWNITLFKEKLIDPEWVAGTATEDSWQTKMLTGKGAVSNDFFTRPSWFMNNGGPKNDPNYTIKVMDPFMDAQGKQTKVPLYQPTYRTDRTFVINAASKDKAEGIIKFMDYVFSDEGRNLMDYGVEGQSYKAAGDKKEYTVQFEKEGNQPLGTPVWNFLQDRLSFPAPVNNAAYYQWMDDLTRSFATTYFDKFTEVTPILKYTTAQLKERKILVGKLQAAIDANLVKFVFGKRPMTEWDAFVSEMDKLGYQKVTDMDQAAYDSSKQ
jgi:putative aldouronate transport system substrate-binding protein